MTGTPARTPRPGNEMNEMNHTTNQRVRHTRPEDHAATRRTGGGDVCLDGRQTVGGMLGLASIDRGRGFSICAPTRDDLKNSVPFVLMALMAALAVNARAGTIEWHWNGEFAPAPPSGGTVTENAFVIFCAVGQSSAICGALESGAFAPSMDGIYWLLMYNQFVAGQTYSYTDEELEPGAQYGINLIFVTDTHDFYYFSNIGTSSTAWDDVPGIAANIGALRISWNGPFAGPVTIPEPATDVLVMAGCAVLGLRRRRHV